MSGIKYSSLLLILLSQLTSPLFADIAPPRFPGYTLSPFDTKDVRMKSEKVDIYYGDVSKIEAVFEILNPTKEIVEKKIGFPFNILIYGRNGRAGNLDSSVKIYDFNLSLNGENLKETDVTEPGTSISDKHYWYGWTCKLKPNLNIVKLTYHIVISRNRNSWERILYYNLNSENKWPGTIDNVTVIIHFPENINKRQVLDETSPQGYEIKEKEIDWRFTPFTPKTESDIVLHLIDFNKFTNMLKYDKILSLPNTDNTTKLEAAKFFASLAPYDGIDISAPTYFKRSYYDKSVYPNLKPSEKVMFDSTYKLHKGSRSEIYCAEFDKNDTRNQVVMEVMNRIGYYEKVEYPVIYKYIEEAKKLFREVVSSDPKNAEAWKAYINNYYLIETGACYPCIRHVGLECDCPDFQKEIVREAFRYCGTDSVISIWYKYLFSKHTLSLPSKISFMRNGGPQSTIMIGLNMGRSKIGYSPLTDSELNILEKAYTMSNDGFFVLKNTNLDEDTQKEFFKIFRGCYFYWNDFCSDLEKFQKSEIKISNKGIGER